MEGYGFKPDFSPCQGSVEGFHWVPSCTSYGSVPPFAVQGGIDADGSIIYVGRAHHENDLIPAKIIPQRGVAYVAYGGEEHAVDNYEVLCRTQPDWVPCENGFVPPGALQGGHTAEGEPLYIGRAHHAGSQTIGKVQPSHQCCYISFGGNEIACATYQVLVVRH